MPFRERSPIHGDRSPTSFWAIHVDDLKKSQSKEDIRYRISPVLAWLEPKHGSVRAYVQDTDVFRKKHIIVVEAGDAGWWGFLDTWNTNDEVIKSLQEFASYRRRIGSQTRGDLVAAFIAKTRGGSDVTER